MGFLETITEKEDFSSSIESLKENTQNGITNTIEHFTKFVEETGSNLEDAIKEMKIAPDKKIVFKTLQIWVNWLGKVESFKVLEKLKMKRISKHLETGVLSIQPNLEQLIVSFLKDYNIIPDKLFKESNPHTVIVNAISELKLKNFRDFSSYIFTKTLTEIKKELTRKCLIDSICKFI